jgi:polysaccharide export outer membrane protein
VRAGAGVAQQPAVPAPIQAPALRIGAGDLLDVSLYDAPELSGHFRVDEKGEIDVPLLGPVRVEGATAEEAGAALEKRYVDADILKPSKAYATVFVSEYATQGIVVNGEVRTPGLFPALGVRMLNDVMTAAGGLLPTSSSLVVIAHRSDPGNPVTVEYNPFALVPVLPQVQVFPGDTITVPRAGMVYVLGDVIRVGAYVLDGRIPMTVQKAMVLAGGSGRGAYMSKSHLVRTLENGKKEDILLNVDSINQGKAPDVAMKDGDILFIPPNNLKLAAQQLINSAISIGSSVLTYRAAAQ